MTLLIQRRHVNHDNIDCHDGDDIHNDNKNNAVYSTYYTASNRDGRQHCVNIKLTAD